MMKNKNVLVAGGTGLVGTNLTLSLKENGTNILSTFFSKKPSVFPKAYERFDFTKFKDCMEATKDRDYVFICAAITSGIKRRKKFPTAFVLPNLQIYAGLLEACSRNKVQKVMLISSSTVYHETTYPVRENEFDLNKSPYDSFLGIGWVNRYVEQLAKLYYKEHGLNIGIVRASYIYGPYDNFDDEKSHVVPALIKRALNEEVPYVVWGDGHEVRDFIYVKDLIGDILDVFSSSYICDPINVGSGKGLTIREAVRDILDVSRHNVEPQYDETKPTSIPYRVLNIEKFQSIFRKKKRTSFREGIENTINWYKSTIK